MQDLPKEVISTDVLVIGGGAAGLMAALEARNRGLDVTIVSKSKVGKSGNTIIAGSVLAMLAPNGDSDDDSNRFYEDTLRSGKEINDRDQVNFYIKETSKIYEKLTHYGITFKTRDGQFIKKRAPGHSIARSLTSEFKAFPYLTRGLSLTLPLLTRVQSSGIKIVDQTPVVKLLLNDGQIAGAVGISKQSNSLVVFHTQSIVMAAGGGGMIFSKSNNTRDITGDSYALAFDAGAVLRDMEFVQFYPTMMFSPVKVTISSPLFGEGAFLRNTIGERFMKNYDPMGDMATRDIMTRAMFSEISEGRGQNGCIFMDCREINPEILKGKFAELLRLLGKFNIDPLKDMLAISPVTHFFMGGIDININTETNVPGLTACGESVGGLHGANRLGGNALSEAFLFGTIAGNHAADTIGTKSKPALPLFEVMPFQKGHASLSELKQSLRTITWKYLSIIRNYEYSQAATDEINRISAGIEDAKIASTKDLIAYYELKGMLTTTRLIIQGAKAREESRGAHFRSDFPETDDSKFKGSFYYQKNKDELNIKYKPAINR